MLVIPPPPSTNGIIYNYTGTAGFTAVFDKQFQYTLSFNDASGNPLSPATASVNLSAQTASTTNTITQYSGFLFNDVYTVTEANWEGSTLGTTSSVQIDLTSGSATKTVSLKAYPASVHVVDNNNNPIGEPTSQLLSSILRAEVSSPIARATFSSAMCLWEHTR